MSKTKSLTAALALAITALALSACASSTLAAHTAETKIKTGGPGTYRADNGVGGVCTFGIPADLQTVRVDCDNMQSEEDMTVMTFTVTDSTGEEFRYMPFIDDAAQDPSCGPRARCDGTFHRENGVAIEKLTYDPADFTPPADVAYVYVTFTTDLVDRHQAEKVS